ncbi:MAG: hypothetical protein REJ50_24890 [Bordetella sp.]|nr:hypothetical protein [Bordetella sp.]
MSLLSIPSPAQTQPYAVGQLWQYHARPGESASRVLINLIETAPLLGNIFHISVLDVAVRNPRSASGLTDELPHFPVSEETLQKSLTQLDGTREPLADHREGYRVWREAFDKQEAGVFTLSVAEIVDLIERAANQ